MQSAIKLTARVLPEKRIEFTAPELTEGEDVELIVLKSNGSGPDTIQYGERQSELRTWNGLCRIG